ncbi:MAG TPA: Na+/H+ antiporter NhaA [Actinomycetes bacterium]|nr:Na+/H+ antiporter NhaA [Actinomycetes bacterium]
MAEQPQLPAPEPPEVARRDRPFVLEALRQETVGGLILGLATVVALVWANSPWQASYVAFRDHEVGPEVLGLHMSLQEWAADGLLCVFFFVAGLELKREVTVGSLARPAQAVLPIVAAVCGMTVPALIFLAVTAGDPRAERGWAVPTATDLAFCLAVLAVTGQAIPGSLRAFLLTLAVVDDFLAIILIAVLFSSGLQPWWLLWAVAGAAVYGLLQHRHVDAWPVLLAVAVAVWLCTQASGVHPTVMAVVLGLLTRVGPAPSPVERFEHALRPFSAGLAVPAFALLSVGIPLSLASLGSALTDRAAVGVIVARVLGKAIGVFGGAWLVVRFTRARLAPDLAWADLFALATLTGIGFTVPLLVSSEAYGVGTPRDRAVTAAVLVSALVAATLASVLLRRRHRHYAARGDGPA